MLRLALSFEKQRQEGEILVATNLHAEGEHDGGGEGGTTRYSVTKNNDGQTSS